MSTPTQPTLSKEVEERFDKQFSGLMQLGTVEGGYDPRPYIKEFIAQEIHGAQQEAFEDGFSHGIDQGYEKAIKDGKQND